MPARLVIRMIGLVAVGLLAGCGNSDSTSTKPTPAACVDGATQPCMCTDGASGSQTCASGKFAACVCATPDAGPTDTGSSAPDTGSPDVASDTASTACPGGPGCACAENTDCQNGLCIDDPNLPEGKACARSCVDSCPDGYQCAQVSPTGGDVVSICVAKYGHLCDPCTTSKDCASLGLKDAQCVDQGALGRFCGIGCSTDANCPSDYTCAEVATVEGGKLKQCVRKADDKQSPYGVCPCSGAAVQKSLKTACFLEVKDGDGKVVGKCAGERVCTAAGLGTCSAPASQPEVCDGADNDCDGATDEATCDDGKPCTKDLCDGKNGCTHSPLDGVPCDADGSVCTDNDSCKAGVCVPGAAINCDDKNPCTKDSCDLAKGCTQVAFDGVPCDADGTACTSGDVCQGGGCQKGQQVVCDDGNPCTNDACDPKTGQCVAKSEDDGIPCDDGTKCTSKDACKAGVCKGAAVDCNDNNACTDDVCDKQKGCSPAPLTGAPCTDDNPCTIGDACDNGACKAGGAKECKSPSSCVVASCDLTADGKCVFKNAKVGTPCDDGSACTQKDGCLDGACDGAVKTCDDGNPCTDDGCDPKTGCTTAANTAPCDADGNACTTGDACKDKACVAGGKKVCDDGEVCTLDSCDPATGKCVFAPQDGKPCDADGSTCTENDACAAGKCAPGKSKNCDDGNACTDDGCDPKTGCTQGFNSNPCSDGNACSALDKCGDGKCAGKPIDPKLDCDDGNGCTTDACDPKLGCTHANNQAACDDGNPCTAGDQCAGGKCEAGSSTCGCQSDADCAAKDDNDLCNGVLFCDKFVAGQFACKTKPGSVVSCDVSLNTTCASQVCEPSTGKCGPKAAADGKGCDADGSVCTAGDACKSGACAAGSAVDCDDKNPCTTDSCDPKLGCVNVANTSACDADGSVCTVADTCKDKVCVAGAKKACDDGNPCTTDGCDAKSGCTLSNNTAGCDDGNACTASDTCGGGACVGQTVSCDDKNPCTTDSCDQKSGCAHVANTAACDADGSACTVGDTCQDKVCLAGSKVTCDDNQPCTVDSCDPKTGKCVFDGAPQEGKPCDDGSLCTEGDTCQGGQCAPGKSKACNDQNPCTDDKCDPKQGCVYVPNSQPCDDGSACTTADLCSGGVCAGKSLNPQVDCSDGNGCTTDGCDPKVGCTNVANQLGCDDGNPCTNGDTCAGKACSPGSNVCGCQKDTDCVDDGDLCNGVLFCDTFKVPYVCKVKATSVVTCDASKDTTCASNTCAPKTGLCAMVAVSDGKPCDADGSVCTNGDSCQAGKCTAGAAVGCDDKNPCTNDSCDPKMGCVNAANTAACDADGSVCTEADTCKDKVCVAGVKKACDDGNVCTTDGCDAKAGCTVANNTAGCDDGNACTASDLCGAGSCAGQAISCDDKNGCTSDSCDPKVGCVNAANTASCDADGSVCTVSDACKDKVCVAGAKKACDDGNVCTTDGCDAKAGCTVVNNTAGCNDGDACTASDTCGGGACKGTGITCDDKDPCTADSCDVGKGCVATALAEKADCSVDGKSWCVGGKCVLKAVCGNAVLEGGETCDDGNNINGDGCSVLCKPDFNPQGLVLHIRPETLKPNAQGKVDSWPDESPMQWKIAQSTLIKQPLFAPVGLNGFSAAQFDGIDDVLPLFADKVLSSPTIFIVYRPSAALKLPAYPFGLGDSDMTGKIAIVELGDGGGTQPDRLDIAHANSCDTGVVFPGVTKIGEPVIVSARLAGTAHGTEIHVLGVAPELSKTGINVPLTVPMGNLTGTGIGGIGGLPGTGAAYAQFGGEVYEVLVFSEPLPNHRWQNVEQYLRLRYGAGLPCGDGKLATSEQCDDGNVKDGDGCSATCSVEPFPSCKAILAKFPNTPDGVYPIDPDGAGPIAAANLFCDMKNGGWTLVGNYYDSAGDDMPNTTDYVVSGWQQTGSGQWANKASTVDRAWGGGTGSGAVSLAFVEALGKAAGQKNLKMCFVHQNGYDTTCRQSSDASMTLVSYATGNPKLTAYKDDKLTYTFGRLAGLAATNDSYSYSSFKAYQEYIPRTAGVVNEFGWDSNGMGEYNIVTCGYSSGVWHGYGAGASFRPADTNNCEVSGSPDCVINPSYCDINVNTYGFRLYIGPAASLGTQTNPATSCKAILDAKDNLNGDGLYWLDGDGPGGAAAVQAYCDMTTDGGGWTKVFGIDISNNVCKAPNPLAVNAGLAAAVAGTGHVNSVALGDYRKIANFAEIRFRCSKSSVGRTIHLKSNNSEVLSFLTGQNVPFPQASGSFSVFADDTSQLVKSPAKWGYTGGNLFVNRWSHQLALVADRMWNHPMFIGFANHWFIDGGTRCECDDYNNSNQNGTWSAWVR